MRSIRFAVLSNARKYITERVVKNGRNDLFSVSFEMPPYTRYYCAASGYFASELDKQQYSIYTEKEKSATDQPLLPQSHFSAVDCFYRDFFAEPTRMMIFRGIYV